MSHLRAGFTEYVSGTIQPSHMCYLAHSELMYRLQLYKVSFLEVTLVCSTVWASRILLSIVGHSPCKMQGSLPCRASLTYGNPTQD